MKIVDLNNLSEEERKKILEEQQARINQRVQENKTRQIQTNQQFNNLISNTGEYDTNKHTFNKSSITKPTVWDKVGFTVSKLAGGGLSGTTGIAQSGILDMANNARKGKDKNALSSTTDFTKSLFGIMNPMQMTNNYISKLPSYIKETVNNVTDKDKTIKEKIINQGLNANNYVINNIPSKDLFNTGTQLAGKINPNLDETLLKANEEIRKPSENYNKYLAEESKKYDNTTNFIASGFESVGNMIPSIVGTALTKNPSVGLATMGLNVKGQATQEALDKGKDLDTAVKIGNAKALVEIATEKISGGAKIFGKGNLDDLAEELVKKGAKSKVGKFLLTQLTNTGGEILEEEISNIANNLIDKGTTDPNKKVIDLKEGLETMGSTAFTTTLLNLLTGGMVSDYKGIKSNQYEDNNAQNTLNQQENVINQNNTPELQQESIQNQQILPTQQTILPTQENVLNQNINANNQLNNIPIQNKSFEDVVFEAMQNIEMNEIESPLQNRNINTIGKQTKTNAYQYDNPKVKPYFQKMAQMIGEDLAYISSTDNRSIKKGGGTKLTATTKAIDMLHNEQGYSYGQIEKGLQNIIEDNGKENNAISKKIELIIDDQLRNGYKNVMGKNIFPDQEYINIINNNQEIDLNKNQTIQNGNEEQILPVQNFYYEKSDNIKVDNLRKDANKYLDNSEKSKNYINMLEKIIQDKNVDIRFDNNLTDSNGNIANGKYENGVITINPNSDRAGEFIAIHELTHAIGTDSMRNIIENYRKSNVEFNNAVKSLLQNYNTTELTDEAMADVSAQLFGNQEYINNLAQTNPSLFRKIYNEIKYLWHQFRGYKNQDQFIEDLQYKWEQAYRNNNKLNNTTNYNLANNAKKVYNIINKSITNNERAQVYDEVRRWRINQEDGIGYIDLSDKGYKSYIYNKQGNDVETLLKVNGSEEFRNYIRKGVEDGTFTTTEGFTKSIAEIKNEYRRYSTNNDSMSRRTSNYSNDKLLDRQVRGEKGSNTTRNVEQNSRNESIENSNESSFSLPKNVKEIKNMNEFLRKNIVRETDRVWKERLKDAQSSSYSRIDNRRTPLQYKREIVQQYLDYKNNNSVSKLTQDNKGRELSKGQQLRYKDVSNELKDENGNLKNYYHGTKRADRVGNIFDPSKATSGPMAFFTDNENIAKSYSENKEDTSLSREYDTEYDLFKVNNKSLDDYWNSLTQEQKNRINQEGYNIGLDEDFENIVHKKDASKNSFSSQYEYYLKNEENNNGIKALYDVFIQDGNLMFEDMKKFEEVLKYAGIDNIEYLDPYKIDSKVYNVYLNIKNPFNTSEISNDIVEKFKSASKNAKTGELYSADMWDKSNISPEQWISRLEDDLQNGTTHAWTAIPDWVTDVLKENGYDGIVDTGGKNGGEEHQVVIPFYSNQIKNVDNLNPTDNPDIRYSKNNQEWQEYLDENIKPKGTRTNLKDIKLPIRQTIKFEIDNLIKNSNQISEEDTAKILTEPLNKNNEKRKLTAFLKANLIDKGMVFEELSRKTGNRELQSKYDYTLTAEARGQNAIGNARYDYQTSTDKNGKIRKGDSEAKQISKSLTDIIDEVGENTENFYNYMYHQLNVDRMTLEERYGGDSGINYERKDVIKNKPVFGEGVTADISRKYVEQMEQKHPEFKEYAQDVYDFLDANKQELVKNGVISQETSDLFKEMYPHYVPIARVDNKGSAINVPLDTKRTGINSPIKRAKGGSRDIQPLFQTMADRTLQTYRASAKNSFGIELKNTLRNTNQLNQISELSDVENVIESLSDENKNNELLQKGENGNNPTFTVFENGEKVTYEISNDMYDVLKPKNEIFKRIDNSVPFKWANKINNFRRGLLTEYNPVFSITNAIKDAQDVLLNSQHSAKTYSKIPEATAQIIKDGYWYKEYIQNGGEQNSYFKDGDFQLEKNNIPSKIKDKITLPLRTISAVNNVIEMTPRLAEYIASREQGKSIESAMLDASRVTTNFKAGGDFTKTLNRNGFTFLNASVQGMQQQIRNIQEANSKGLKGYAVLASKYAIAGLPVLLLNNLIWSDDDDYDDLQDYVKDNYYIIGKTKNGTFIRIPKGRAVATIQKIVSNVNDFIKDDKINTDDVGKEFWNDLKEDVSFAVDNLAPNNPLDNNIIAPLVQVGKNKTWYGEDLVPKRLQSKPKEEQYDETTDWLSKWIGEQFKVSPMKINYLIDQYSGGVGDVILPTMTPQAENNVLEDKFTTNPTMKNKYPGKFFEKIDELTIANNSEKATDLDKVKYKYASDLQSEISDLYKEKRNIQNSSDDDKTKKEKLQEVQEKINSLTQKGLEKIDEIKINKNTSSIDGQNYYKYDGKWKKLTDEENEKLGKLPLEIYADYKNKINEETNKKRSTGDIEEDGQLKSKDKINILRNSNYSDKDKKEIYSNFINSKDNTYLNLSKLTNVNIDEYLDYKMQNITGDEDTKSNVKGKTVKGSKEEKVRNYLKNSKMSDIEKIYICAKNYKLIKDEKETLKEYMNKLSDKDKLSICKDLTPNFELHKDGNYYWK